MMPEHDAALHAVTVLPRGGERLELRITERGGCAEAIVWPGMGAQSRSLHRIELDESAQTVVLEHRSEAAYYVAAGTAAIIDEESGERIELPEGSMVHIGARHPYRLTASAPTELIGGPCPPDLALYEGGARR